jgi:biopolymer transport protein ExbB/TolQ/DNA-directed RNA polymerase subunit RPC12/RpoP
MSAIQFACSQCGNQIMVDSSVLGMEVVCPYCAGKTIAAVDRLEMAQSIRALVPPARTPTPPTLPASPTSGPSQPRGGGAFWGDTPALLKRSDARSRVVAALVGITFGLVFSLLCFQFAPPKSTLEQLFDFRSVQVIVPLSIMAVFFWGLLLCTFRWRRIIACEKVATPELADKAAKLLIDEGVKRMAARLEDPAAEFNPLLARLKALVNQWQLKPGLIEADVVLQQFIADDADNTRRAYSLTRTFVWGLPVLGLIGTVLGIAFAVGGFATFLGSNVSDVEVIKKSLVGVTGGLSFAFLLTLLGLATSLLLMLVASALETREDQFHQTIQQQVVIRFLPVLQRVSADNEAGQSKYSPMFDPMKEAAEAMLNHVAALATTHVTKLSDVLSAQQHQVTTWGQGLQDQASSAAAVLKSTLEEAAKNLSTSGGEFLARLDLVRQTWKEQSDLLTSNLQKQTTTNESLGVQLVSATQQQFEASQTLSQTLKSMQTALADSATAVQSLEAGLRRLVESPLEKTAGALVQSLDAVGKESERVTTTLATLTSSTQVTAQTQAQVHEAIRQLHDLKLVETLASFRDALARHATLVDKLNTGLKITVG